MEEKNLGELAYLISYPKGFHEDQKYPLVIYLHGAGSRGVTMDILRNNTCVQNFLKRQDARGYVFIAPLCKSGDWNEWMAPLIHLVENYREIAYIDETRIHLTGNSMGGYGTWALTTLRPDWFASAMPLCGGGIGGFAKKLVNVPIRAFHGLRDRVVDPIESLQMAKAVNQQGGHAELILFPELEHNCWTAVYSDEKNYDWFLSFTTERNKAPTEDLSGAYYG